MWWAWPHLRRLWAGVGTLIAGLTVTYVYNLWSRQAVPDLRSAFGFLHDYWLWTVGTLVGLTALSFVAEQAHRRHETRAPQPLRVARRSWRERLKGQTSPVTPIVEPASTMVGRIAELAQLKDWFARVKAGTRRIIFVSGEPGIGKTTLTRAFLDSTSTDRNVRIGRGQCVEQYGSGEPYMPILEALIRLCREPGGDKLVEILHRMAPAWLAQMPSLVSAEDRVRLQGLAQGTTQQRMLREMAEALEVIAANTPLVLFLEDLHWSDPSTLDLIATVARRTESARLMILGTYRPVEMLAGDHPLRAMKEELELHRNCIELSLPLLNESDVATYLAQRLDEKKSLASSIYRRTEGNPLFMVNVVDYLLEQGSLADADKIEAPRNIRQMIERNLQVLSADEQRILEAASVAGMEFSTAAVAVALERPLVEIDACCTRLARNQQFIDSGGAATWPDGTVASGWRFHHALYQETLYDRIPSSHRITLHLRVAELMEASYGSHVNAIAAELANHYGKANNAEKAAHYFQLAAERAAARRAYREAERHYRDALAMMLMQPESKERDRREFKLQIELGSLFVATQGWSAIDTTAAYMRAQTLAGSVGDAEALDVFRGLWTTTVTQRELKASLDLADQMLQAGKRSQQPRALATAHFMQGHSRFFLGEIAAAREHHHRVVDHYREEDFREAPEDLRVYAISIWPIEDWMLGYPDRALLQRNEARELARRLNKPFGVVAADFPIILLDFLLSDFAHARAIAEEQEKLSADLGFPIHREVGRIARAWASAQLDEIGGAAETICKALAELDAIRFNLTRGCLLTLLAEVYVLSGAFEKALTTFQQALDASTEERLFQPITLTLRGELLLRKDQHQIDLAEGDFRDAIKLSRQLGMKSPELRATTSLARLLRDTGRRDEARTMLSEIYNWFTEGFDTKDLKEAQTLLDELNKGPG